MQPKSFLDRVKSMKNTNTTHTASRRRLFVSISSRPAYLAGSYDVRAVGAVLNVYVSKLTTGRIHVVAQRGDVYNGPAFFDSWKDAFSHLRGEIAHRLHMARVIARQQAVARQRERAAAQSKEDARRSYLTKEERDAEDARTDSLFALLMSAAA